MPRQLVIMTVAGLLAAAFVGIGFIAAGQPVSGGLVLGGACLATFLNVVLVRRSRAIDRPGVSRRRGSVTGRVLLPTYSAAPAAPWEVSWTGGGNVATGMGRMNATWPLAVLTTHGQDLVLRFRPAVLARMLGVTEPFAWHISDVITAYPVRGRLVALSYGLAIESTTTPLAYFWTTRPAAILADLSARGVPVDWTERYVKLL
jgi:hypothetical protein